MDQYLICKVFLFVPQPLTFVGQTLFIKERYHTDLALYRLIALSNSVFASRLLSLKVLKHKIVSVVYLVNLNQEDKL